MSQQLITELNLACDEINHLIVITPDAGVRAGLQEKRSELLQLLDDEIMQQVSESSQEFSDALSALRESTSRAQEARRELEEDAAKIEKAAETVEKVADVLAKLGQVVTLV
ncbi:hypothetical protein [Microbulbifer sp.]|uniref:hypothetical protein n=1 Tax=Microbulbifer sp. TaxID=1908541 RepID=UPI003F2C1415